MQQSKSSHRRRKVKLLRTLAANKDPPPTTEDLGNEVSEITDVVANGLKKTGQEAGASLRENVTGDQKDTLLFRLKDSE